jgi:zinc and cadmium transporter
MLEVYLYIFGSILVVSAASLIGVVLLGFNQAFLHRILYILIAFSAGALLGDVFIHIIPEIAEIGFSPLTGIYFLIGIIAFFLLEQYIHWHHGYGEHEESVHSSTYLTIFGDALHNFIDGIIIAISFLVSIPFGIATTVAVLFHEIPQELGQFGILVHGGWSRGKALLYNFLSALTAILGAAFVVMFAQDLAEVPTYLLAFAGASFLYIAMSEIIPELHKEKNVGKSVVQILAFLFGVVVMAALLILE